MLPADQASWVPIANSNTPIRRVTVLAQRTAARSSGHITDETVTLRTPSESGNGAQSPPQRGVTALAKRTAARITGRSTGGIVTPRTLSESGDGAQPTTL